MTLNDFELIKNFHKCAGHSKNTIKNYSVAFKKYTLFHGMSLSELLSEAIVDQENNVPDNRLKLYNRLMSFREYLIDSHVGNTIPSTLSKIKTFYKYNRINVPFIPPINTKTINKNPCISYEDLLSKNEIKKALSISCDDVAMWIYVMLSSGSSRLEAKSLTNEIFYKGTWMYHRKDDFYDALKCLSKRDDVVCTCKLTRRKTDKPYYTFLNPECVQFIAKAKLENDDYELNTSLLKGSLDYLGREFRFLNDYLNLGYAGGYRRFRPHMLRKFNATQLNQGSLNSNDLADMNVIDYLHGRGKNATREAYFKNNPRFLKLSYIKCMNNISLYHCYSYKIIDSEVIVYCHDLK